MTEELDQEQIKLLEAASTIKRTKFLPAHFNNKRNARYLNHHYIDSGKSIHSMEQRNIYSIKQLANKLLFKQPIFFPVTFQEFFTLPCVIHL